MLPGSAHRAATVAGPIRRRVGADLSIVPPAVSPMAGRHVFRYRRLFCDSAHAHVGCDPLTLEDFDRPAVTARSTSARRRSYRDAIVMTATSM